MPVIEKEFNDLINYFKHVLPFSTKKKSITLILSIDQKWKKEDLKKIEVAIKESIAFDSIKKIKFINCNILKKDSIYVRKLTDNLSKYYVPEFGLKSGPNIQFFRSFEKILKFKEKFSAVLLQEVDTISLKENWIDLLNIEIKNYSNKLLIGSKYNGRSKLGFNHYNGNSIYCVSNNYFKEYLRLWKKLVKEVVKIQPLKAYDSSTEWAINFAKGNKVWSLPLKNKKYFYSNEFKRYVDLYNRYTCELNGILNLAGDEEINENYIFEPILFKKELSKSVVLHLRSALGFKDLCRFLTDPNYLKKSNVIGYDDVWQFPTITEKQAYIQSKKNLKNFDKSIIYFGFPWATLIDKLINQKADAYKLLDILGQYKYFLRNFKKIVTVCQHVYLKKYIFLFSEIGVTDIFWSHTSIEEEKIFYLEKTFYLHPFPLFPVQNEEISKEKFFDIKKKYLFSFIGTKSKSNYLSNSRNLIFEDLSKEKNGFILKNESWFYEKIVYDYQIKNKKILKNELSNSLDSKLFKQTLQNSLFSLCPSGTGVNSIRLWESIHFGIIPVVLSDNFLPPGSNKLWKNSCIFVPEKRENIINLPINLKKISKNKNKLLKMKKNLFLLKNTYGKEKLITGIELFFKNFNHNNNKKHSNIILFVPFYKSFSKKRQNELNYCLKNNLKNKEINKIILFVEKKHKISFKNPKLKIMNLNSRQTFKDWINLSEKQPKESIIVLANADIFFDKSIKKIRQIFNRDPKAFVCLSRYNKTNNNKYILHENPHWSQDVWAFYNIKSFKNYFKDYLKISLGVPRCDNKIASIFAEYGYSIYNPCFFIKAKHMHQSNLRDYNKTRDISVLGTVAYVYPSKNLCEKSKLVFEFWALNFNQIKEVSLNKTLEKIN